ncbi:MAG: tRNA epoxyqueuosine(34) reductase QueG [Paracoccaceae bacterium]|nr:tRNA epoxyqueuosine(34) reductase QueG [Paracoccaceae bacterium]
MSADEPSLTDALKARAKAEGFAASGICRPDAIPEAGRHLAGYLAAGYHGQMSWMERRAEWRGNPSVLWPAARSVIMLADAYTPEHDPLAVLKRPDRAAISVYALNEDYHGLIKKRLKRLGRWLINRVPGAEIKVFVDTAPVMEKPLAAAAGLGWQGKHTNLLSRQLGNWFFLGALFTTAELEPDQPTPKDGHCGRCRACLDICPTDAFPAPYQLDARRCISYLTIEHRGPVDTALRPDLGNRIFGCDDCLAVCPWNKFAVRARQAGYQARKDLRQLRLSDLASLDDTGFRALFRKSPVRRIGRDRLVRNVLYAIGNSGRIDLAPSAAARLGDGDGAVRDAARWALDRLRTATRARNSATERDANGANTP